TVRATTSPSAGDVGCLLVVGVTAILGQLAMNQALDTTSAATAGTIAQLTPVTTLVLGALFLGEPVNALALLGAGVTLAGVVWATLLAQSGSRITPERV